MANFCKFCGKELANGVCDCEAARAEKEKVKMKFDASETLNVCKRFLQNPVGMISEAASPEQKKCMLLAGGIHLAVIVLISLLRIPPMEWIGIGVGEKFGIGFLAAIFIGVVNLLIASATFGICRLLKIERDFGDVLAVFSSTTVLLSAGYVVAFITSYVSVVLTAVLLTVMLVAWIVLVNEVVVTCLGKGRNFGFWITMVSVAIGAIVVVIVGQNVLIALFDSTLGGMGNFLTMW